ncbi:metastasis-suppressor KiSS-1 [Myotis daubentonii]|uniref:metastasis-suppressor KiSS-1 n=1 Tax=Myotis daubentonii TaxID=98922 RepID=UPI00287379C7|nr:metastasis-suppressor KiSS-1 [Myotis daubentonii]
MSSALTVLCQWCQAHVHDMSVWTQPSSGVSKGRGCPLPSHWLCPGAQPRPGPDLVPPPSLCLGLMAPLGPALLTRMNLLVSWQLTLFLCAISFRDTLEKVAPVENPRATEGQQRFTWPHAVSFCGFVLGQQLDPLSLGIAREQSGRCAAPASAEGSRPALGQPSSHRIPPPPPGKALVRREKGLSAFNWNSFGLRYGRRQAGGLRPRAVPRDQGRPAAD